MEPTQPTDPNAPGQPGAGNTPATPSPHSTPANATPPASQSQPYVATSPTRPASITTPVVGEPLRPGRHRSGMARLFRGLLVFLGLLLVGVAIAAAIIWPRRKELLEKAKPTLVDVKVESFELVGDSLIMRVHPIFKNPNPLRLFIDSASYYGEVAGQSFMVARSGSVELRPRDTDSLPTRLALHLQNFRKIVLARQGQDSTPVQIVARVYYQFFGPQVATITRTVMAPTPPFVTLDGVEFKGIKDGKLNLEARLRVQNPGVMQASVGPLQYRFSIPGLSTVKGSDPEGFLIIPRQEHVTTLPLSIDLPNPLALAGAALGGNTVRYELDVNTVYTSAALPQVGGIPLKIKSSGNLPLSELTGGKKGGSSTNDGSEGSNEGPATDDSKTDVGRALQDISDAANDIFGPKKKEKPKEPTK